MGMKPSASRTGREPHQTPAAFKAHTSAEREGTASRAAGRKPPVPSRIATFASSAQRHSSASVPWTNDPPDAPASDVRPDLYGEDSGPVTTQQEFFAAIIEGNADRVAACIAYGADILPHGNATQQTPILLACRLGRTKVLPLLIQAGADLESCGMDGKTALMAATEKNRTSIMSLLLDGGASIRTLDGDHHTLLILAIMFESHEAGIRLLHAGVLVDAKDKLHRTALTYALLNNSDKNVVTLLAAGANFTGGS